MEKAILMAAGMGTRMRPLTNDTPKPLVTVNGTPMIQTVIEGLKKRGVKDITIVTGYLAEKFAEFQKQYPDIKLINNPDYNEINNISSLYYAREELRSGADCFICEADLYVSDADMFLADIADSCYFGKFVKGHSDDWVFDQDENGRITRVGKVGDDVYNMCGVAYFKANEAKAIADAIENQYGKTGFETMFWDDVVNNNLDSINLTVHPVLDSQIVEIDTVSELEMVEKLLKK